MDEAEDAPGSPGETPHWAPSAKELVGCALGQSRLWFTVGKGIVSEVYFPRLDIPQIKCISFIVADGKGFWVDVGKVGRYSLQLVKPGIPALTISHVHEKFTLRIRISPDIDRDVLLLEVILDADPALSPYVRLCPRLGADGVKNRAEVAKVRGRTILLADQGPFGLALAAVDAKQKDAFKAASAGYAGSSDILRDFEQNGAMCWQYRQAGPGNVVLGAQLPQQAMLSLGFGISKNSAATLAVSGLLQPFQGAWDAHVAAWEQWHSRSLSRYSMCSDLPQHLRDMLVTSAMVLRVHQDRIFPGAMVASLSIPWGSVGGRVGGYHLVWPRDLVESAGALLAMGAEDEARDILRYLIATQQEDGHWNQNQWLGGTPYWEGIQLDETALPVLLAATLVDRVASDGIEIREMVRKALSFIVARGPASEQDRWEENAGVNAFTLAACIAALVVGAPFLDRDAREAALDLADFWNEHIEEWNTVTQSPLQQKLGVRGYYVRISPLLSADIPLQSRMMPVKNHLAASEVRPDELVALDFLQLVRFGLRLPDDPMILDSIKVADELLRVETPAGICWHRYNGDGYGEHEDGSGFDGSGIGRAWPLLAGERGHYELAAGRDPRPYLEAMAKMAGAGGMIPEQIWDSEALPQYGLYPGKPTGSAMPLVWAHAEYVKLVFSLYAGFAIDRPREVWERYRGQKPLARRAFWLQQAPIAHMRREAILVIALQQKSWIRWGFDGWQHVREMQTRPISIGLHLLELDTTGLESGQKIDFTYRTEAGWIGRDYQVEVA